MATIITIECDTFSDLGKVADKHVGHAGGFTDNNTGFKCVECNTNAYLKFSAAAFSFGIDFPSVTPTSAPITHEPIPASINV